MSSDPLQPIIARLLDGDASPEETQEALEAIRSDPERAAEVAWLLELERLLRGLGPSENFGDSFADEVLVRIRMEPTEVDATQSPSPTYTYTKQTKRRWNQIGWTYLAAAACVALIATVFWFSIRPASVARLVSIEDASWAENETLVLGDWIPKRTLQLESGFAELEFRSGALLLLEGPVTLEIADSMRVRMRQGRISAKVPESAHGFTIDSPVAEIVDLGTEFGVDVSPSGETEVHVIKGLVKARNRDDGDFQNVSEDQAVKVSEDRLRFSKADPSRFLRNLPHRDPLEPASWIRFSFDENAGSLAHAATQGRFEQTHNAQLTSFYDSRPGPVWQEGVFGTCLSFDGTDDYLKTTFSGVEGSKARTIAFWVRAPQSDEINGYAILGYGKWETGQAWQISLNPVVEAGPLGRIRVGAKDGEVIGTRDLRDGKWHHVAVVLYPGNEVNLATNVLIYLDGKLEPTSRKSFLAVDTSTGEDSHPVIMGMAANELADYREDYFFEGALDEVHIFDRALSKPQILSLMQSNEI